MTFISLLWPAFLVTTVIVVGWALIVYSGQFMIDEGSWLRKAFGIAIIITVLTLWFAGAAYVQTNQEQKATIKMESE